MTIIQLGNYNQCMGNGVPAEAIYEFGIVKGFINKNGFCTALHNSAQHMWSSIPRDRTTFKLEILF